MKRNGAYVPLTEDRYDEIRRRLAAGQDIEVMTFEEYEQVLFRAEARQDVVTVELATAYAVSSGWEA